MPGRFWRSYDYKKLPPYTRQECDFCGRDFGEGWVHPGDHLIWQCKRCHWNMQKEITQVNKQMKGE